MVVTATEFKTNFGKYIMLADMEDIIITKNGRSVAKLTNAREVNLIRLSSLRGVLKDHDATLEIIRAERLGKYNEVLD